ASRSQASGNLWASNRNKAQCQSSATHKNTSLKYGSRRGASLLISLGITTILMLMAVGIATTVTSSIRDSANLNRSREAYYGAEGALEAGLMANSEKGPGYSTNGQVPVYFGNFKTCESNDLDCLAKAPKYEIKGQVQKKYFSGDYGIPTPGTGTVGKNCNPLKAQIKDPLYFNAIDGKYYPSLDLDNKYILVDPPEENPCNWNKIKYGESVSIPLYVTVDQQYMEANNLTCDLDPSNPKKDSYICNPKDLGLTSLIIRVRTPCEKGEEMCIQGHRYDLNDQNQGDLKVGYDDAVLDWQIQASDKGGGKSYVMVPYYKYNDITAYDSSDSEIYESRINSYPSNQLEINQNSGVGMDISPGGKQKGSIYNFLTNLTPWNLDGGIIRTAPTDAINKPVLKLTVINKLVDLNNGGGSIPNLEYQILINTTKISPADSSQTVTAEAFSGGFKQVLESKTAQQGNQIQYVIQQ
ncbi:MAG: pilus assembly PilX N-terminal domain-containing protein, partial [Candidatus Gracilibacteria bacterium]